MKLFLSVILISVTLFSANIDTFATEEGYYRDYQKGLALAKKEKKLLMLVMVADYCPWCRKFERKTLSNTIVAAKIKNDFIAVIMDKVLDKKHYPKVYETPLIPVVFFIEPKQETVLYESIAYVKKNEYLEILDDVLDMYQTEEER